MCEDQKDTATVKLSEEMFEYMDGGTSFIHHNVRALINQAEVRSTVGETVDVTIATLIDQKQSLELLINDAEYVVNQLSIFLSNLKRMAEE